MDISEIQSFSHRCSFSTLHFQSLKNKWNSQANSSHKCKPIQLTLTATGQSSCTKIKASTFLDVPDPLPSSWEGLCSCRSLRGGNEQNDEQIHMQREWERTDTILGNHIIPFPFETLWEPYLFSHKDKVMSS